MDKESPYYAWAIDLVYKHGDVLVPTLVELRTVLTDLLDKIETEEIYLEDPEVRAREIIERLNGSM